MTLNLILSVNYPINWGPVIRATHSHQPESLYLIHIPKISVDSYHFEIPENLSDWFNQHEIKVSFDILKDGEKLEYPTEHCIRLDALSGATFSQVKLIDSLPDNLEVWATSSAGTESVRLDDEGTINFPPLDPIEGLRLMGQDSSFKEVEPIGFDLTILEPYIQHSDNCARLNHYSLEKDHDLDVFKENLILKDRADIQLKIDSRSRDGFWLEDVIMEHLAIKYSERSGRLFRNFTINRGDVEEQFISGIHRMLGNQPKQILPRQRLDIAESLGIDPWRYRTKSIEYNSIIDEITMDMFEEIPITTYQDILDAGSINEFDAVLIDNNKIITIEVKSSRPRMYMVAKLTALISKHLTPLKKKGLLIHGYDPEGDDVEEFEHELELWSKLFPDIEVVSWFELIGLSTPDSRNPDINSNRKPFIPSNRKIRSRIANDITGDVKDLSLLKIEVQIHNKVLRFLTYLCPGRLEYFKGIKRVQESWHLVANSDKVIGRLIGKGKRSILGQLNALIPELNMSKIYGNDSENK